MTLQQQLNSAVEHYKNGNTGLANRMIEQMTNQSPSFAPAWFEKSGLDTARGQIRTSLFSTKKAYDLDNNLRYRTQLAQRYIEYGLSGDAFNLLNDLDIESTTEAILLNAIGSILSLTAHEDTAQNWLERALKYAPNSPHYLFNVAQGNVHCGKIGNAITGFEKLLTKYPNHSRGRWALTSVSGPDGRDKRIDELRAGLKRNSPDTLDHVLLQYALFNELDAIDEFGAAFSALSEGMKIQKKRVGFSSQESEKVFSQLRIRAFRTIVNGQPLNECNAIDNIFIVGMPRSGTTMLERILSNHDSVSQGGELRDFSAVLRNAMLDEGSEVLPDNFFTSNAHCNFHEIGENYIRSTLHKRSSKRVLTDKLPFNFMLVPWILTSLPNSIVININRDPIDTCFSNLKMLFTKKFKPCYDQVDIADYYKSYRDLMDDWKLLFPQRIISVEYEKLVQEPIQQSKLIAKACGLVNDDNLHKIEFNINPVATASTAQVRKPITSKSVYAWKRYENHLDPLVNQLKMHGLCD